MSAQWRDEAPAEAAPALRAMTSAHLDAVLAIENAAYDFPWTRGNFIDSLLAGYPARVLVGARGDLIGYFVGMDGVEEMHLLNITVAPPMQGRGHARRLLDGLLALCRERRVAALWLEVRTSNAHARAIYTRMGFLEQGIRKGYYPAPLARREDAVVMSLKIGAVDALE